MIGKLCGMVDRVDGNRILIMVGGVGYILNTSTGTASLLGTPVGKEVCVETYLAVRENSLDLYGFLDTKERTWFTLLLMVSGIGPKSAIGILSVVDPSTLEKAIMTQDTLYLTKVSGIGKKNAEKIVLELKDKVATLTEDTSLSMGNDVEALEALLALGYSQREARNALSMSTGGSTDTNERIKSALRFLGSK